MHAIIMIKIKVFFISKKLADVGAYFYFSAFRENIYIFIFFF